MKKPSFLERLTGSVNADQYEEVLDSEHDFGDDDEAVAVSHYENEGESEWHGQDEEMDDEVVQEGELPVDMYQTGDAIIIRALVAGVAPEDLDIAITRDMVTIKGMREEFREAHAQEKHGLLEIKLPKVDKGRSTKLKVKSNAK